MSNECRLCGIYTLECSADVRAAVYYLIGRNAPADEGICEAHLRVQVLGLAVLATLTGHGEYAAKIRQALDAPMLRLVPPETGGPDHGQ